MLGSIINLFLLITPVFSEKTMEWSVDKPYIYTGFIYTDSQVVVINPAIQIKINNNEEICNFFLNKSDSDDGALLPFRAIVKSAHLGVGELIIKPNIDLDGWINKDITFFILAEACHDPDSWSVPASVSIKVLKPPGPLWMMKSYSVSVNGNAPIGTTVIKVTAYLTTWTNVENKICQYFIKNPSTSLFQIDGEGTIKTKEKLENSESQYFTLIVVAEDCSQPIHRQSKVNVFVTINPGCKFGWTGFYSVLKYKAGSGIKYLSNNPTFQLCDYTESNDPSNSADITIKECIGNKTLRLTTSVELKFQPVTSADLNQSNQRNCKLDYESLKLQREVCGINDSKAVELLSELNRQRTGVLMLPIQANIFPVISREMENKFSFYFWIKRQQMLEDIDEYIICQIDEIGNNIFSVSFQKCALRIQLKSYKNKYQMKNGEESIPTVWIFRFPQFCDSEWHHIVILGTRAYENPYYAELGLFIDGETVDNKSDNPQIILNTPLEPISSNMTDVFLGQCPKSVKTEFRGLLAGVVLAPGIILKSSTSRCLIKCSERLFFNGMNQMNPGMSVSLNSEMRMIIINGHSIAEVAKLIKVIGFVNPTWNPEYKERELSIETEMSCGTKIYNVPSIKVKIKIEKQRSTKIYKDTLTFITLFSRVTSILIPDSTQVNFDMGTGVAVFANTSLDISGIPQSTNSKKYDYLPTVSKCVVTIKPKLKKNEFLDWPRHLLEAVSAEKYSIIVINSSRVITFKGLHNQQVYQFVIQHLKYFSIPIDNSVKQSIRTFKLQCFSYVGKVIIKSNVAAVEVTIWYNNYNAIDDASTAASSNGLSTLAEEGIWRDIDYNISMIRGNVPLHAQSNAARISEIERFSRTTSNTVYNIFLGFGIVTLICIFILFIKKSRKKQSLEGCILPYQVVDRICFPLQMIKEKIKPSPSVRVELSRDFINCTASRRRDISMEMQWDDTEMKPNHGFNIIANPLYEKAVADIDDNCFNKDVPPTCEEEDSSSNDDTYEDFTEIYFERNQRNAKNKNKIK